MLLLSFLVLQTSDYTASSESGGELVEDDSSEISSVNMVLDLLGLLVALVEHSGCTLVDELAELVHPSL